MAVSVGEICENTKLAREMALMGNYESALVYYEGTVQMIHRLLITIADTTRKSKWQLLVRHIAHILMLIKVYWLIARSGSMILVLTQCAYASSPEGVTKTITGRLVAMLIAPYRTLLGIKKNGWKDFPGIFIGNYG
ncbi:Katanin p60 ATPase-containing subunit [Papilio machaon]|uniref:Katanin p60 ATPase-containing subunit n=1 Tax=Papilio machaon TaxID=76193 RepID=A0A194RMA9_PAPMA|nr:Katanin p60 ATPase-containing subunit [Papilio machaon]